MPIINLSYTSKINPPNASPQLTPTQIWAGLQRKIRFAQEFVPVILSCTVVAEDAATGTVTREVVFKPGTAAKERAREVVTSFWPSWVEFEQEDGTHIRNIISDSGDGGVADLCMTYAFQFRVEGEEGSEGVDKEVVRLKKVSLFFSFLFDLLLVWRVRVRG